MTIKEYCGRELIRSIHWSSGRRVSKNSVRLCCFLTIILFVPGRERGMRSLGLTQFKYRKQLVEWLDLSTKKDIPISLLIMSRAFMLSSTTDEPEKVLQSSMSSLDSDTVNEVVLAAASAGEENTIDIRKRKLESIQFQREVVLSL